MVVVGQPGGKGVAHFPDGRGTGKREKKHFAVLVFAIQSPQKHNHGNS